MIRKFSFRLAVASRLLCLLLAALTYFACTSGIIPATGEKRFLGYTWEQEIEIGKQTSKQVAQLFGVYRDPKLERYVTEVGNRVLATSHLRRPGAQQEFRDTPVTFTVLDSPTINAMALPGGYVYVTRGMLGHLNNEDQLAAVLAHEIGHITARHAARQAFQQQLGQGLLLGGALIGGVLGLPAENILNLGGMAAQLLFLRHSREDELEADTLSVEYSSLAGYDPREVIGLFRTLARMEEKEGQGMPSFLSTHPNPGNRIERINQLTARMRPEKRPGPRDPQRYLQAIEGLVIGEDPRQGFVEGNVFYHPELRFRFPVPRGFKVVNQPTQVIMVEGQNRALLGFTMTGERSLQTAASKFLNQPGLKVLERGATRSNGLPAYMAIVDAVMENRQPVRLLVYYVDYGGKIYHFLGYTAPQAFASFRGAFLQTMQGFGRVDDPQILNREPVRLGLEQAAKTAPFRDLIPRRLPAPMRPEDVAPLNQVALNEEIRRGTILKIPRTR